MAGTKRKSKRSLQKYPDLNPKVNLRSRTEQLDYDYLHLLSEEELKFLNQFSKEYVNASFKKSTRDNLHKTKAAKKDCYDRNNARNRDVLTKEKARKRIKYLEEVKKITTNPEEDMNNQIDIDLLGLRKKR